LPTIEAISTTYLEADTASVTFSSIPATYEHLQLRVSSKSSAAGSHDNNRLRFNSDAGSNYVWHYMYGYGSAVAAAAYVAQSSALIPWHAAANESTVYGASVVDILDYRNTNKNTTVSVLTGLTLSTNWTSLMSCLWLSTAAVTSITITPYGASNLVRGSEFTLYGLKSS